MNQESQTIRVEGGISALEHRRMVALGTRDHRAEGRTAEETHERIPGKGVDGKIKAKNQAHRPLKKASSAEEKIRVPEAIRGRTRSNSARAY
jgi:hypothetical protein